MNKSIIRILSLILGIFFIITSLVLNNQLLRIIILILGIFFLVLFNVIERTHKKIAILIFTFILLLLAQILDYVAIKYFNKSPILIYQIIDSASIRVYNSLFYRVWQCNINEDVYIIDNLDKIGYFCETKNLDSTNINTYAVELVTNYDKYLDTFIKVNGIVSEVTDDYFLLRSYIIKDNNIIFNNNISLKIYFNRYLDDIKVNDKIELTGRVGKKEDKQIIIEDYEIN